MGIFLLNKYLLNTAFYSIIKRLNSFLKMNYCKSEILEIRKERSILTKIVKTVIHYKRKKIHKSEIQNAEDLLEQELNNLDS